MSLTLLKNQNLVMKKNSSIITENFVIGDQKGMKKMGIFSIDENEEYIALEKSYQEIASEHDNLLKFLADYYPEVLKEWEGEN